MDELLMACLGLLAFRVSPGFRIVFLLVFYHRSLRYNRGVMAGIIQDIDLHDMQAGTKLFVNAVPPTLVRSVLDINGDNKSEILIGCYQYSPKMGNSVKSFAGGTYLIWGNHNLSAPIDLTQWNNSTLLGIRFDGANNFDSSGVAVNSISDINGDGKPEILIGASKTSFHGRANAGSVYLIWGNSNLPAIINLADWNNSSLGIRFDGAVGGIDSKTGDLTGIAVVSVPDINGDGLAEILIGASGADPQQRVDAGSVYLIWGNASLAPIVDLATWNNTSLGIRFDGANKDMWLGYALASLSDINGDNKSEILLGSPLASQSSRNSSGSAYLIWGNQALPPIIDLAKWDQNKWGIRFDGAAADDKCGFTVSSLLDINDDKKPEMMIASPSANTRTLKSAGRVYIIFNNANLTPVVDLAQWEQNHWGIRIDGSFNYSNLSPGLSALPDLNADGRAELLLGAPYLGFKEKSNAGLFHLIWGNPNLPSVTNLSFLATNKRSIRFDGAATDDATGYSLDSMPDISGDNLSEILVSSLGPSGKVYIVFSELFNQTVEVSIVDPTTSLYTPSQTTIAAAPTKTDSKTEALMASASADNSTVSIAIGSSVAAVLCCAGIFGAGLLLLRKRQAAQSRAGAELEKIVARIVYERLHIIGVANFDSGTGAKYVEQIRNLINLYQQRNGNIPSPQEFAGSLAVAINEILGMDSEVTKQGGSFKFNIANENKRQPLVRQAELILQRLNDIEPNSEKNMLL